MAGRAVDVADQAQRAVEAAVARFGRIDVLVKDALRLQLGADCAARVEQKLTDIRRELDEWRPVALATAFDA
jgi:NAD(P)-dependent dehydrogenase (short-subunit alcohol dehydrogenase family)